jgi:endonuclease G
MKLKHLLIYLFVPLALASCKRDIDEPAPEEPIVVTPPVVVPDVPKPYNINEDFESGVKGAYAVADATMSTGSWNYNDALLGNLAADLKNGAKSVRLRTGSLTMNFDVTGLNTLYIKHGKYGTDANSTWQLLMSTDGGTTFNQVGTDIAETNTTLVLDSFKVASTTGKVRFQIKKSGTARINIDDIAFKGTGESGITIGGSDTPPNDNAGNTGGGGTPAAARGVTLGADAPPVTGDNSNVLFGNPSGAANISVDNYLLDMGYYVESYSATRGTPNWVSWHLDATSSTNATPRLDNFAAFNGLPTGAYAVQSTSYQNSGFDRGHNCPSADRTSSANANSATFLMTNMIPQAPQNNQQTWNNLEGYLRNQVTAGNEVYIVMGSYGNGGVGKNNASVVTTIDNGHVAVPTNVWKVAVIIPTGNSDLIRAADASAIRVIAVNTPNINSISTDWTRYLVTVRDIEKAVGNGFNLLSALPQSVQDALETKKDAGI